MAAPRLTLVARKPVEDVADLLEDQTALRQSVFASRGVIIPRIVYRQSTDFDDEQVELRLDDRMIGSYSAWMFGYDDLPGLFFRDLELHAGAMVVPSLVEHYLQTIAESFPDLVASARGAFTLTALTEHLAKRVAVGASIRDFRGVLEELLEAVA